MTSDTNRIVPVICRLFIHLEILPIEPVPSSSYFKVEWSVRVPNKLVCSFKSDLSQCQALCLRLLQITFSTWRRLDTSEGIRTRLSGATSHCLGGSDSWSHWRKSRMQSSDWTSRRSKGTSTYGSHLLKQVKLQSITKTYGMYAKAWKLIEHLLCSLNHLRAICRATITENQEVGGSTSSVQGSLCSFQTFNKMGSATCRKAISLLRNEALSFCRSLASEMQLACFTEGNQGKPGPRQSKEERESFTASQLKCL